MLPMDATNHLQGYNVYSIYTNTHMGKQTNVINQSNMSSCIKSDIKDANHYSSVLINTSFSVT